MTKFPLTLEKLLIVFKDEIGAQDGMIKFCNFGKCDIETPEGKAIQEKPYSIPQALEKDGILYFEDLLNSRVIRRSQSVW
ncbi:hypothetical protein BDAP_000510 [Binucleata daphniae]